MVRGLVDTALNILFGDRFPDPKILKLLHDKINDISLLRLGNILLEYRLKSHGDRNKLMEQLRIKTELPESRGLWDDLVFCGSGLTESMFDNVNSIEGSYSHKMLIDIYSSEFIELFDYLWKRDKVLRKLEWDLLKIGRLYNRDFIIFVLDNEMMDIIRKGDLIDIIEGGNEDMVYGIGKSLVYMSRGIKYYNDFKKWLKSDSLHATVILSNSLNKDGKYDKKNLKERYENRIKSDKKLKKLL